MKVVYCRLFIHFELYNVYFKYTKANSNSIFN